MNRRVGMVMSGAWALALMGVALPVAAQEYRLSDRDVAIYNMAGRVEVVAGTGSEVIVEVTIGGQDGERLSVEVDQIDGAEALRIIYPDDQIVYREMSRRSNNTVSVRADGTFYGNSRGRGDRVRISGSGRGLEAHADLRITIPVGKVVEIFLAVGEMSAVGVRSDIRLDTGSGEVTTRDTEGNMIVDTGSGRVSITDHRGSLLADTGSGRVDLQNIVGDEIVIDTGSGGVRGSGLEARRLSVDTGSGGVELTDVTASDVMVDTGSGSVEIELTIDVERLDVDTGSGSVTIYMPGDVGAEIEVDTGSGGIDVDFPVRVREMSRTYLNGEIGDGRGRIHIDTGSGSVRLVRR